MAKFKPRRTLMTVQWGGYVATEPETRSAGPKEVIAFSFAWNNVTSDGEEKTDWVRVQCWSGNPLFDIISQYVTKGSAVMVTGRLRIEYYTNKDGEEKKGFIIDLENLQLLGSATERVQRGDADESIEAEDAYTPVRGKTAPATREAAKAAPPARRVQKKSSNEDTPF